MDVILSWADPKNSRVRSILLALKFFSSALVQPRDYSPCIWFQYLTWTFLIYIKWLQANCRCGNFNWSSLCYCLENSLWNKKLPLIPVVIGVGPLYVLILVFRKNKEINPNAIHFPLVSLKGRAVVNDCLQMSSQLLTGNTWNCGDLPWGTHSIVYFISYYLFPVSECVVYCFLINKLVFVAALCH